MVVDDARIHALSRANLRTTEHEIVIVVPHVFYLELIMSLSSHIRFLAPDAIEMLTVVGDYAETDGELFGLGPCFRAEHRKTCEFLETTGLKLLDAGRQLLLENLYSLACYAINSKYIIFLDDDFFVYEADVFDRLLEHLRGGSRLVGLMDSTSRRIHTCIFGLDASYIRNNLSLFDNGENLYTDEVLDTGSLLFEELRGQERGTMVLGNYRDGCSELGIHLGHCASEVWCDMPQVLRKANLHCGRFCAKGADGLLEGLGRKRGLVDLPVEYAPVENELRRDGANRLDQYLSRILANHRYLKRLLQ